MKLIKKIIVKTELEILTGLHIGGNSDSTEIGGVDKPILRCSKDNIPYIPGSSLKGKIRSLLEQIEGCAEIGDNDRINSIFGFAKDDRPSKIIVRDAMMTEKSIELLKYSDYTDMPFSEIKYENSINRVKGTAVNPRQIERVPAGATFNVEFVINVWETKEGTDEDNTINLLKKGLQVLENDYLGGNGSRGYGKVKFHDCKEEIIDLQKLIKNES